MGKRPIGIFDSGLGGLTVLREIHRLLPGENLVYFGDSKRAPYGTKSREAIINFAFQDMRFMLSKGVKAVVIACNTVSSNAIDEIRNEFDIPIVEVISPGAKAGAGATNNGRIGVIGTPATIESGAYKARLGECEVYSKSCPLFVPLVEEGRDFWDSEISELAVRHYLEEIKGKGIDTLILGCTHYPLLSSVIGRFMGPDVRLIDSAVSIAEILRDGNLIKKNGPDGGKIELYTSDSPERFMPLCRDILGKDGITAGHVDIEMF